MGIILGTTAYMSPEQAKGLAADRRSDLWAFGCVLYEMLTGRRAFAGDDVSDTVAAVLRAEPQWELLPAATPASIHTLLLRCLKKDRKHRLDSAAAARLEIDAALAAPVTKVAAGGATASRVPLWRKAMPWAMVAIVGLVAGYAGWTLKPSDPRSVTRFVITLGEGDRFTPGRHWVAISPDGSRFAYTANGRLFFRRVEQLDATPLVGGGDTDLLSPRNPFFSPDGEWIGYWHAGQLKKVSVSGGAPVTLCTLEIPPFGASWSDDNTILLAPGGPEISRVSGDGGTLERVITLEADQRAHGPQLLPDGRSVLFTLARASQVWDEAQVVIQSLDGGARQVLVDGGTDGRYLPSGHLLYALRDTLLAVPFDAASLSTRGGPVPVVEGVRRQEPPTAAAQFAVSSHGTLVYVPATTVTAALRTLTWVDRQGREESIPAPPREYMSLRLAPDGTRLALDIGGVNRDIWVWDLSRRTLTPVTTERSADAIPVWTPNGQRLIFGSDRLSARTNLFWQAADGTGTAEQLTEGRSRIAYSMSPDGARLVLRGGGGTTGSDLLMLDMENVRRPGEPTPLLQTPFEETGAEISPDGRWLAYQSNSSGVFEVYVRPFPDVSSGQSLVSTAGGSEPRWSRDGRELFYRARTGAVVHVPVTTGSTWAAGAPTQLFEAPSYAASSSGTVRTYDVSADARRFVMMKTTDPPARTSTGERIVVVQNWFEELKRRVPTK